MINSTFGLTITFSRKKLRLTLLVLAFTLLFPLSACANNVKQPALPPPEEGKANVVGKVQSSQGEPYQNFNVRLAEVYWQGETGAYVLDESFSPGGISDADGRFQILNVPAGEYVVVLGEPNQEYKTVTDSNDVLKRITVVAGETFDLGTITFDY